jgi:peptidyl-prolyl cis-trans isomerase C
MKVQFSYLHKSLALAAFLVLMVSPASAKENSGPQKKAAVVNGSVITKNDFEREVQVVLQRSGGMEQIPDGAQMVKLREAVLDQMIGTRLLYLKAQEEGFTVNDKVVSEELSFFKSRIPSEEQFSRWMLEMNITEPELKARLKQDLTIKKFLEKKFVEKVAVSGAEADKFYKENQERFKQPEAVLASHIFVPLPAAANDGAKKTARQEIAAIHKQLKEGRDFAVLALEFYKDVPAPAPGYLGYVYRGQVEPAFEQAAFALKPGQVSDIVETRSGYHLIKIWEKKPEELVSFQEAEEDIKEFLKQQKVKEGIEAYMVQAKKNAKVEIMPES